jgi:hypothetical protein
VSGKEGVDESAQYYGDTIVDANGAEFDAPKRAPQIL